MAVQELFKENLFLMTSLGVPLQVAILHLEQKTKIFWQYMPKCSDDVGFFLNIDFLK